MKRRCFTSMKLAGNVRARWHQPLAHRAGEAAHVNPLPRYWVAETEIDKKLGDHGTHNALIGWRRICRATDARTLSSLRDHGLATAIAALALPSRVGPNQAVGVIPCGLRLASKLGHNMNFFPSAVAHRDQRCSPADLPSSDRSPAGSASGSTASMVDPRSHRSRASPRRTRRCCLPPLRT